MLHTPITANDQADPDVQQAIDDFRQIGARIRDYSGRAARLDPGTRERLNLESQIQTDMAALDLRADRLGGDWDGAALLVAIHNDIDGRARRVAQPQRVTARVHADRVTQAQARKARATLALAAAERELESAISHLQACEHAAKHAEARRAAR